MYCQFIYCLISYFKVQIDLAVVAVTFRLTLLSQVAITGIRISAFALKKEQRSKRQLRNSLWWPIFIIKQANKSKLILIYSPLTQHHSFFTNYSLLLLALLILVPVS